MQFHYHHCHLFQCLVLFDQQQMLLRLHLLMLFRLDRLYLRRRLILVTEMLMVCFLLHLSLLHHY